jgi:hypothetical protein
LSYRTFLRVSHPFCHVQFLAKSSAVPAKWSCTTLQIKTESPKNYL